MEKDGKAAYERVKRNGATVCICVGRRHAAQSSCWRRNPSCSRRGRYGGSLEDQYTKGCTGGSSWFPSLSRQPHSEDCRSRFAELMEKDFRSWNATMRTTASGEGGMVQRDERGPETEKELEEVWKREGHDGELGSESAHHVGRRANTGDNAQPRSNPKACCRSALLRKRRFMSTTLR